MTPVMCHVKHDPEAGTYGDCLRVCVASLLDLEAADVTHFFHDDCDGATGNARLVEFLSGQGYAPFWSHYPGELSLDDVLGHQGAQNPTCHYLLFGRVASGGDHVVVCKGGEIVHDPAWLQSPLIGPNETGFWGVMVLARA